MSKGQLSYKGFQGSSEVSFDDNCLFGKILHIDDLVTYEADTPQDLEAAFQQAVEDYLALCQTEGKLPNKPYKGSLNVRIGPDLHKKVAETASAAGKSINDFIKDALQSFLKPRAQQVVLHRHEHHHHAFELEAGIREFAYSEDAPEWQVPNNQTH